MFLTYMGMLFSLHQHQLEEKNQFWCCLVFDSQKTVQSSRLMRESEIVASLKTLIYT